MRDFFSSRIGNRHNRRAYTEAVRQFIDFCATTGIAGGTTPSSSIIILPWVAELLALSKQ